MRHILVLAALIVAAPLVVAQETDRADRQMAGNQVLVKDLVGRDVKNPSGEDLGEIEEIVLTADGEINYAVLSFERFLGLSEKWFAVPFEAFKPSPDGKSMILNVSEEKLKNAPGFDKNKWPATASAEWAQVDEFYERSPGKRGGWGGKASKLDDGKLHNGAGQKIADVEHIVLDLDRSRASLILVDPEDRIVAGGKYVALPWSAVTVKPGDEVLQLNPPEYTLQTAPSFAKDKWPPIDRELIDRASAHFGRDQIGERPVGAGEPGRPVRPGTEPDRPRTERPDRPRTEGAEGERPELRAELTRVIVYQPLRASRLLNAKVADASGQAAGTVKDLIIHPTMGTVEYLVIDSQHEQGKLIAVPMQVVKVRGEGEISLDVAGDKLREAPTFTEETWPDTNLAAWHVDVHRFYGTQPSCAGDTLRRGERNWDRMRDRDGELREGRDGDRLRPERRNREERERDKERSGRTAEGK